MRDGREKKRVARTHVLVTKRIHLNLFQRRRLPAMRASPLLKASAPPPRFGTFMLSTGFFFPFLLRAPAPMGLIGAEENFEGM